MLSRSRREQGRTHRLSLVYVASPYGLTVEFIVILCAMREGERVLPKSLKLKSSQDPVNEFSMAVGLKICEEVGVHKAENGPRARRERVRPRKLKWQAGRWCACASSTGRDGQLARQLQPSTNTCYQYNLFPVGKHSGMFLFSYIVCGSFNAW